MNNKASVGIKPVGGISFGSWRARLSTSAVTLAFSLALILIVTGIASAQALANLSVIVKEGETLRDLAGKYLQDPNLWQEILRENHIDDVTAVVPGKKLNIPVAKILRADRFLEAALATIQRATQVGARVFARDLIDRAVQLHNMALLRRKAGAWEETAQTAAQARKKAEDAAAETMAKRDVKARAILSDRQGTVDKRKPEDLVWQETLLNGILIEQEKVRTLSQSQAEITFQDESRLRLNENSQAIIRSMRVDPLEKNQKTQVSLVSGDVYALLKGTSGRKKFQVDVKDVELQNASRNFRVIRDTVATKVANYDSGRMQVTSAGSTVTLGKNQGTIVKHQQKPEAASELLKSPELDRPEDREEIFQHNATLTWKPVASAVSYWLEIASDPIFQRSVVNHWGVITETHFSVSHLATGVYYWRVAAIDSSGLPGATSQMRRFAIQSDVDAPYLMIASPEDGRLIRQNPAQLVGETERSALLTLNGQPVNVESNGKFALDYTLQRGVNTLAFEAQDQAGYVTRRQRTLLYMPDQEAVIRYDPALPRLQAKHFLVQGDTLSLSGVTTAQWQIQTHSASGRIWTSAFADESGRFRLNIPVKRENERFTLLAISPSGFVTKDAFTLTRDQKPPTITVDELPPRVTRLPEFRLRGRVRDADVARLNGRVITLSQERFDTSVALVPGRNRIEFTAVDQVGNKAVASWVVLHDVDPPELVSHRVSWPRSSASNLLIIEVAARDVAGLKQAAPYQLQVGRDVQSGFLRLNQASQSYQAITPLPQGAQNSVRLKLVELEDYAGNRKAYAFK